MVLRRAYLPWKLSPTGVYKNPERVSIHSLGYRILSTAEIEHFIEDRCVEVAKTALASWRARRHLSQTILHLAAFSGMRFPPPPDTVNPTPGFQKDWDDLVSPNHRIDRCVSHYVRYVTKENNGVREKNLMKMLVPLGIDPRMVDQTFISRLDNLASLRGDAAHLSTRHAVRIGVDPATELKRVTDLKTGLRAVDATIDALLLAAR
jgi:hypothetical protein